MIVSLILPAHNEENRLRPTLKKYNQSLCEKYPNSYEILVIANGCTDRTVQVAQEFASTCSQVKVFDILEPIGKGGAILKGFCLATGQFVAFADADCATRPSSLIDLIDQLINTDIVIGSRWLNTSRVLHKQPLKRRIYSRFFNLSIRFLFNLPYRDTQCGAKVFRRIAALKLAQVVKEKHWMFDVDLLLWANFFGYRVKEFPVTWEDQAGSKLEFGSTFQEVLASLWRLKHRKMKTILEKNMTSSPKKVQL